MHTRSGWICAPDSFKGTVDSVTAARGLAQGLHPLPTRVLPMGDGGEGTALAIEASQGGRWVNTSLGPARLGGPPQKGRWLDLGNRCAFVEFAQGAALETVPSTHPPDPGKMSSHPVGELICSALDSGARRLVIGLGGSGTVDGGAGLLQALGGRFQAAGTTLRAPITASDLQILESLDLTEVRRRFRGISCTLAADVVNPLLGPQGAIAQYGAQKGLRPEEFVRFEEGLRRFSRLMGAKADQPGDGAAGGAAFGLRAGAGGTLVAGAQLVGTLVGLQEACSSAEWVVTGEGRYDDQTRQGKVPWAVARCARACGAKVALVAGQIDPATLPEIKRMFDFHLELSGCLKDVTASSGTESALQEAGRQLRVRLASSKPPLEP